MPDITTTNYTTPPVVYSVTVEELRAKLAPYRECAFDSPAAYRDGARAIAVCRSLRGEIEATRRQLKTGALEYGRRVDSVAKSLVALVEETEEPLKLAKAKVDEAKERERQAKLRAEREAEEARLRAAREAEEARLRAAREAEEARLRAEREAIEAERAALAAERAAAEEAARIERARVEAEQAAERARLAAEREALDAERRKTEQARLAAERQEAARLAAEEATRLAAERAERQRIEAEEAAVREAERQAELARRREALRPDRERLAAYLDALLSVPVPTLADAGLQSVAASVGAFLRARLGECEGGE